MRPSRREITTALAVAVGFVGLLVLDAHWRGVLGIARNDDWSYSRTAFAFGETGHVALNGWASATLVGQIVPAAPIVVVAGRTVAGLQWFTAAQGALALWVWFVVLRRVLPTRLAAASCAALAVGPLFGVLAVSFMGDVPSLLTQGLTLLLGVKAVESERGVWWLAAAAAMGAFSFSIREYGAIAFVAVALVFVAHRLAQSRPKDIRGAELIAIAYVATIVVLWQWRRHLPHDHPFPIESHSFSELAHVFPRVALSAALLVAPAAFLVSPRRLVSSAFRSSRALTLVALGLVAACGSLAGGSTVVGDYVTRHGSRPNAVTGGDGFTVNRGVWALIIGIALWSLATLALLTVTAGASGWRAMAGRRQLLDTIARSPVEITLALFIGIASLLFAAVVLTAPAFFDRYLLMAIPAYAGIALVAANRLHVLVRGRSQGAVLAAVALFAVVGLGFVDGAAAAEGARWQLGEKAVAGGTDASTIDAGFEWYSFHQDRDTVLVSPRVGQPFWNALFPGPMCATVTATPPNAPVIARETAASLLGSAKFFLVAGPDSCH